MCHYASLWSQINDALEKKFWFKVSDFFFLPKSRNIYNLREIVLNHDKLIITKGLSNAPIFAAFNKWSVLPVGLL